MHTKTSPARNASTLFTVGHMHRCRYRCYRSDRPLLIKTKNNFGINFAYRSSGNAVFRKITMFWSFRALAAASFFAAIIGSPALAATLVADFNTPLDQQVTAFSVGGVDISIRAVDRDKRLKQAWIYDTSAGKTPYGDGDLTSPFSQVVNDVVTSNSRDMGGALIIQEPGATLADDNARGGRLILDFDALVTVHAVDLLDTRAGKVTVKLFDAAGAEIAKVKNQEDADTGNNRSDNLFETLLLGDIANVSKMTVVFRESGALDNLVFSSAMMAAPLPGAAVLFGGALGLFGAAGWRRRRHLSRHSRR